MLCTLYNIFYILTYTGDQCKIWAPQSTATPCQSSALGGTPCCSPVFLPVITACGLKHLSFPLTEVFVSIILDEPHCHHAALSWDVYMLMYVPTVCCSCCISSLCSPWLLKVVSLHCSQLTQVWSEHYCTTATCSSRASLISRLL